MVIHFDEKSNKCNFTECRCYEDGECTGCEERKLCLEMAFAMLGVDYGRTNITGEGNNRETGDV